MGFVGFLRGFERYIYFFLLISRLGYDWECFGIIKLEELI